MSRTDQKERTHETILESAASLLRDRGIFGTSVADVMKGAGLTVGGFYAHFASKEELMTETLRRGSLRLRNRIFNRIEEKPEGDRAEVVIKRYLSAAHRDLELQGCPLPAVVGEIATGAPEYSAALSESLEPFIRELEGVLPLSRPQPLSKRQMAIGILALMYGGLTLARAVRGTALSDEVLKACRALGRFAVKDST